MKVALYEMSLSGSVVPLEHHKSYDKDPAMTRVSAITNIGLALPPNPAKTERERKLEAAQAIFNQAKAQLEALQNDES